MDVWPLGCAVSCTSGMNLAYVMLLAAVSHPPAWGVTQLDGCGLPLPSQANFHLTEKLGAPADLVFLLLLVCRLHRSAVQRLWNMTLGIRKTCLNRVPVMKGKLAHLIENRGQH